MMRKNNSGITLISLVITIILLLILATIGISSGISTVRSSRLTKFTTEMKLMQQKVNELYDSYTNNRTVNLAENEYTGTDIANIGNDISDVSEEQRNEVFSSSGSGITDTSGYKYYNVSIIDGLGIDGVDGEFFVNVAKRSVISVDGFEYEGNKYYTLEQLPEGLYNVEYNPQQVEGGPTFDVDYKEIGENKWRVTISNIQYDGYINKWNVKYQKEGNDFWNTSENMSFEISEQGIYKVKLFNEDVETSDENIRTIELLGDYIKEGLILHYDAINNIGEGDSKHSTSTTVWKDLSGNGNDGMLKNFDTTEESGWKDSFLKFDGVNDTVDTGLEGATTFTSDDNYTLEIVFNMNNVTATGSQYEKNDQGIIFGATDYCGYAIFWDTDSTDKYNLYVAHRYSDGYGNLGNNAMTSISKEITNINQMNSVSQIYNRTDNKLLMLLNSELVLRKSMIEDYAKEYDRAEYMGNIMINRTAYMSGTPRIVHSDMNVYSVRIYDRALTEEETKINQKIDMKRFEF